MRVPRVLILLLLSGAAYAGTGAITLDNKSTDVLTMYGGDSDHSCDADPGKQCTIELQPGEYKVLVAYLGTSHVVAKATVTVEDGKEQVLTITD